MAQVGREMGAREVVAPPLPRRYDVNTYKSTHMQGGTIMGSNPGELGGEHVAAALADVESLRAGRFDVSTERSGNPTLTILAQTLRTADAIVGRYVKRPGLLG